MNEKNYTLKGVTSEIKKIRKSLETKKSQVDKLTSEIKAETKKLKELESVYTTLNNENLQKQIATAWFKDNSMTTEQIEKFLKLSAEIQDKIDVLEVSDIVDAVTTVYNAQKTSSSENTSEDKEITKVDTNINFSEKRGDKL